MCVETTLTGTVRCHGIELLEYPPPAPLMKGMAQQRALDLVFKGKLRMWSMSYFRALEESGRGDANEGKGLLKLHGLPMTRDACHPLYMVCFTAKH